MSGGIYLIQGDDQLVEMTEKPYDSEALLQDLLEKYPNLLAVDQSDNGVPRRWLLVKRKIGLPAEDLGQTRWSHNHLFLDQNAIPTLVEVKSNDDSRLRKEVIGQMIEYAANAVVYWPVESILAQFESNCRDLNRDPEAVFEDFLGANTDEEHFWQQVKTNLQAGKVRLVFVADHIPTDLQRVVEFLNKQMDPAEAIAVEIKQYVSAENGLKTLVSKVIGRTAEAQQRKASTTRERRQWDEHSFFSEYELRYGDDETLLVQKIYEWVVSYTPDLQVQWGIGDINGGFAAKLNLKNRREKSYELFFVGIDGTLQISSSTYANMPPFNSHLEWQELRNQFSSIGLALPSDPTERRFPNFQLSTLTDEYGLEQVLSTFDWTVSKIRSNLTS
ncbi:hypothetical protein [Oscillatoria salina]|uniref:hypothetical protein n=1 Tax=Oscillatoria salina TaxID=331517 RepID=UPI0013B69DC0|nr:hypothetical protein [Oscillatoria salina]MBZ8181599.1 hypothetical protein [Oscillatoria salina IIICB1]NET89835.1 hypothetical protein [Kamptonema sp. SIO1D9]